jgi:hypothetical protein
MAYNKLSATERSRAIILSNDSYFRTRPGKNLSNVTIQSNQAIALLNEANAADIGVKKAANGGVDITSPSTGRKTSVSAAALQRINADVEQFVPKSSALADTGSIFPKLLKALVAADITASTYLALRQALAGDFSAASQTMGGLIGRLALGYHASVLGARLGISAAAAFGIAATSGIGVAAMVGVGLVAGIAGAAAGTVIGEIGAALLGAVYGKLTGKGWSFDWPPSHARRFDPLVLDLNGDGVKLTSLYG